MIYIYLDESGDLGFDFRKKGCTKKFVITLLVCFSDRSRRAFRKAIERTIKNKINKNKKKVSSVELKGAKTEINVKKYFLRNVKCDEWSIYTLILNKKHVNDNLRTSRGKKKLYNFLSRVLIEKLAPLLQNVEGKVELIVDKSKNTEEISDFNQYLGNQLEALLPLLVPLNIYHLNSSESFELQAVDLFCWGVFRKYERSDGEWYGCFVDKISCEVRYLE